MFYQFVHYAVQQLLSSFSGSKIYAFLMCELNSLEVVCFSCQCVTADSSRNCEFYVCVCVCDILYTACAYREWFIFCRIDCCANMLFTNINIVAVSCHFLGLAISRCAVMVLGINIVNI